MEIGGAVNLMGNASITELFSLLSIRFNFPRSSAPPRGRLNQDDTVVGQATERRIARCNSDCVPRIAAMTSHDSRKARPWHKLHELCEQRLSKVHRSLSEGSISGDYSNLSFRNMISN